MTFLSTVNGIDSSLTNTNDSILTDIPLFDISYIILLIL